MRAILIIACAALLISAPGCKLHDALFGMFGNSYSGGGPSSTEKQRDFDDRVQDSQDYARANR